LLRQDLGSARVSRVGFGVSPKKSFLAAVITPEKSALTRRQRQHARRVRYPIRCRDALQYAAIPLTPPKKQNFYLRNPSVDCQSCVDEVV
jgi:hypothetical protein